MHEFHGRECDKSHTKGQVTNATLIVRAERVMSCAMKGRFRDALIWHMEQDGTGVTELARATGVSRDAINKIIARENSSTDAEKAVLIAAYYGKDLGEFMNLRDPGVEHPIAALAELLTPDEARLLEAQIRGLIAGRDPQ
jgi:transcriptional regulator with XRE-family HTH domain